MHLRVLISFKRFEKVALRFEIDDKVREWFRLPFGMPQTEFPDAKVPALWLEVASGKPLVEKDGGDVVVKFHLKKSHEESKEQLKKDAELFRLNG